jgi:hypothetical protein
VFLHDFIAVILLVKYFYFELFLFIFLLLLDNINSCRLKFDSRTAIVKLGLVLLSSFGFWLYFDASFLLESAEVSFRSPSFLLTLEMFVMSMKFDSSI